MSEETGNRNPLHQAEELWKQWYDTSSKVWSEASIPTDPFTFFKQWYESSHETWSKAIEEIISSEMFVEAASHYIESYTTFYKNFRRLNEDYFSHLQLTTRSDMTRIAEMIIALENKVDSIQDASEDLQSQYPQFATLASIQQLASYLQSLEQRLDQLPSTLKKIDDDLHQHLNSVEHKLNAIAPTLQKLDALQGLDTHLDGIKETLKALPATLTQNASSAHLEKRLDGVEQKLDTLVALLERIDTHQPAAKTTATRTSRSSNSKTRTTPKTPKIESEDTSSSTK